MATYGFDFYGLSKYGARQAVDYGVEPFTATATDYSTVNLTWSTPAGDWTRFRLLRSRQGFSVNENDGVVLLSEDTSAGVPTRAVDDEQSGGWNYYSIFLYNGPRARWERASTTSLLVPYDFGSSEKLLSLIPQYYRVVRDNAAGFSASQYELNPQIYSQAVNTLDNDALNLWMFCFGWGFDVVRSHIDSTLDGYNTDTMHVNRLGLLADQFGATLESTVPAHNNRNLVKNLALLYRQRGTINGIRETLSLSSGWNVDVYAGPNLMLNTEQSEFDFPKASVWNPFTRYVVDDIVLFGRWYFKAVAVAYGQDQAPASTRSNNTWWNATTFANVLPVRNTVNPLTNDISSWQVFNLGTGLATRGQTAVGMGVTDPLNETGANTNALIAYNSHTLASSLTVRSVPAPPESESYRRDLVIGYGIPVPRVLNTYDNSVTYYRGDRIVFEGIAYEAAHTTVGALPTDTSLWNRLGYHERPRLNLSFYAHGPFTNPVTGSTGVTVNPYISTFDEKGDFLAEYVLATPTGAFFYDTFSVNTGQVAPGRTAEVGSGTWSEGTGVWNIVHDSENGYRATPVSLSRTFQVVDAGVSNVNIGVTLRDVRTRETGLVFRYSNPTNFWFCTNTRIGYVNNGVTSSVTMHASPLKNGDRLRVLASGDSIYVLVNNSLTSQRLVQPFNQNATKFGIYGEAAA